MLFGFCLFLSLDASLFSFAFRLGLRFSFGSSFGFLFALGGFNLLTLDALGFFLGFALSFFSRDSFGFELVFLGLDGSSLALDFGLFCRYPLALFFQALLLF